MNYFGHLFKICTLVRSSSRSLMHQKLRAALSVSGIVCGIAAVFTMICIGEGARLATLKQIAELGVKNIIIKEKKLTESKKSLAIQNLSNGLTMGDVEQIKATLPSLDHVAPLKEVHASTFKAGEKFSPLILAATPDFFKIKKLSTLQGRSLQNSDRKEMKLVAVVGDEVARKLGKEGKPGGTIRIENSLFTIVGVLDTFSGRLKKKPDISIRNFNQAVFIPLGVEKIFEVHPERPTAQGLTEVIIQTESKESVPGSAKIVARALEVSHSGVDDYSIVVPGALLRQMNEAQQNFNTLLGSIATISLLAGGIGIMNILLATVSERRREIGIRRAVGASQAQILIQFLSESLLLTLTGGMFGLLAGIILVRMLALYSSWETAIVPWAAFVSLGMALLTGLFFGLYPAFHASKVDPIVALRYE